MRLTPEQFVAQWMSADHKFLVNVHDFEVSISKKAVEVFQDSFETKKFNGQSWPSWKAGFVGKGSLLDETGTLRKSIKVKSISNHFISIHTDPGAFHSAARHKGFCYAGVHNNLNEITPKPPKGPTQQRQFIGDDSKELDDEFSKLNRIIFRGLPK